MKNLAILLLIVTIVSFLLDKHLHDATMFAVVHDDYKKEYDDLRKQVDELEFKKLSRERIKALKERLEELKNEKTAN